MVSDVGPDRAQILKLRLFDGCSLLEFFSNLIGLIRHFAHFIASLRFTS